MLVSVVGWLLPMMPATLTEVRVHGAVEGGIEVGVGDVAVELKDFCVGVVFVEPCSGVCKKSLVEVCDGNAFASSLGECFGDGSANA